MNKKQDIVVLSVVLVALVLARVFFNIPNFNPLGAVALMGGLLFGKKLWAFVVPLGALFIGDVFLSFSSPIEAQYLFSTSFMFVYASFALIIALGIALNKNPNATKILGGSLAAAVLFFLVSNAGSWLAYDVYPNNFSGLMSAYEAGIPFFRSTLVSQVLFSLGIYVVYNLATNKKLALA
ncbi:MAG: DUF6580 family putative transport protein [Bacteroidia bacterium]